MYDLTKLFRPVTAQPALNSLYYSETAPCEALSPYIRCFWGTLRPVSGAAAFAERMLVIPDGCMDVIFRADISNGTVTSAFCGMDTNGASGGRFVAYPGSTATFGVRFYLWGASLFSSRELSGTGCRTVNAWELFPEFCRRMSEYLGYGNTLIQNARYAEGLLMERLAEPDSNMMNALYLMLTHNGSVTSRELEIHTGCSRKRLERIFRECTGSTPKSAASVLRYQLMWQEMLTSPDFSVLDAVVKYGYYDQPHLLNDFRRRHTMTPQAALEHARAAPHN